MKNVLLATTALVAFAGAAAAEISFEGSVEAGYNVPYAGNSLANSGAVFADLEFTVRANREFNGGIVGEAWMTIADGDGAKGGEDDSGDQVSLDGFNLELEAYGASLESGAYKMTVSNDIDNASEHFDGDIGAWIVEAELGGNKDNVVRLDASFSSVDVSVSYDDGYTDESIAVGMSGTFGNFDLGVGYDSKDAGGADDGYGINAGTTFGAFSMNAFYGENVTDLGGTGYGIHLGYDVTSDISLGAYYHDYDVSGLGGAFGVDAKATFGAITVAAYYDAINHDNTGDLTNVPASRFGIDMDYAFSSDLVASAGYRSVQHDAGIADADKTADGFYAGVEYNLSEDAKVGASYAEFDDAGTPGFRDGATVWFSFDF